MDGGIASANFSRSLAARYLILGRNPTFEVCTITDEKDWIQSPRKIYGRLRTPGTGRERVLSCQANFGRHYTSTFGWSTPATSLSPTAQQMYTASAHRTRSPFADNSESRSYSSVLQWIFQR